jgi:hypothetical protein
MTTIENNMRIYNSYTDLEKKIFEDTGCKIYSGTGINNRLENQTSILRSVDDTKYYKDNLSNPYNISYTLCGQIGDQDLNHRLNKTLLDPQKIKNIYLYRKVLENDKCTGYMWYGKYELDRNNIKQVMHTDRNGNQRKIYLCTLTK